MANISPPLPPIGLSKNKCVVTIPEPRLVLRPNTLGCVGPCIREFAQWIVSHECRDISMIEDADEATEHLLSLLSVHYDKYFPEKRQRMSDDNKPWMTTRILRLMDQRRKAYDCGRMVQWRELYFKIKIEVKKAKKKESQIDRTKSNELK